MHHPNTLIIAFLAALTSLFFFLAYRSIVEYKGALSQIINFFIASVILGTTIYYYYRPSIFMVDSNNFKPNETAIFTFTGDTVLIMHMTVGAQAVGGPFWEVMYKDNLGKLNFAEIPESKIKKINP